MNINSTKKAELEYIMRTTGVNFTGLGGILLQNAITVKLENPDSSKEDVLKSITDGNFRRNVDITRKMAERRLEATRGTTYLKSDKECAFELMRYAVVENVNTKHAEKLLDDDVVWRYISNVGTEINLRENIELDHPEISEKWKDILTRIALRRFNPPRNTQGCFVKQTFGEVLLWVGEKYGYVSAKGLLEALSKEMGKSISKEKLENYVEDLVKTNQVIFYD